MMKIVEGLYVQMCWCLSSYYDMICFTTEFDQYSTSYYMETSFATLGSNFYSESKLSSDEGQSGLSNLF